MTFVMKLSKSEEEPMVVSWWRLYHIAVFIMKQQKGTEVSVPYSALQCNIFSAQSFRLKTFIFIV